MYSNIHLPILLLEKELNFVDNILLSVIVIISPGSISLINVAPIVSKAHVSLAKI